MSILLTLKSVWHRAICNEYFSVLAGPLKLANIPVTVVPFILCKLIKQKSIKQKYIFYFDLKFIFSFLNDSPNSPIFDPKVRGKTLSNETKPMPTNGVKVDVNTELLWNNTVMAAPSYSKFK